MYLMALPMAVLFGWDIHIIIFVTGFVVTAYSFIGGIVAVVWADAVQAVVLLAGAVLALAILLSAMPGGVSEVLAVAGDRDKFSLGSPSMLDVSNPTIWVVLAFGVFDNLRNFGVDQSYIQRYIAAPTDREAAKSVWLGAMLYIPVSALFLLIGSSLFAFYESHPGELQEVRTIVAEQRLMQAGVSAHSPDYAGQLAQTKDELSAGDLADRVFPHFIASQLPQGARGLLIAAIFAAAMSTVSTSLNSSATLVMSDFYQRLVSPESNDAQRLGILRGSTIVWGSLGTAMAFMLVRMTDSVLDVWWLLSSVLGSAIVGLFLLGLMVPTINQRRAMGVLGFAMVVIAWMAVSRTTYWPKSLEPIASPLHPFLVIVVGPLVMCSLGWGLSKFQSDQVRTAKDGHWNE